MCLLYEMKPVSTYRDKRAEDAKIKDELWKLRHELPNLVTQRSHVGQGASFFTQDVSWINFWG